MPWNRCNPDNAKKPVKMKTIVTDSNKKMVDTLREISINQR